MIKEIQYTGYEASTPDNLASDGSLSAAVGLVNQDGGMRATSEANEVLRLPDGYSVIFNHKISNGDVNCIILSPEKCLCWIRNNEELSDGNRIQGVQFNDFTDIECVGNTLVVLSDTTHYILWKNDTYNYLGTKVPNIEISFGLQGNYHCIDHSDLNVSLADKITKETIYNEFTENNKYAVTNKVMGELNKNVQALGKSIGNFVHPFFLRYAIRLYDGTVVNRSAPIYMQPCMMPYVEFRDSDGSFIKFRIHLVSAHIDYKILNIGKEELKRWQDIITGIDVYVSKPIYFYKEAGYIKQISSTASEYNNHLFIGRLRCKANPVFFSDNWAAESFHFNNGDIEYRTDNYVVDEDRTPYSEWSLDFIRRMIIKKQDLRTENLLLEIYKESEIKEIISGNNPCYLLYTIETEELVKEDYIYFSESWANIFNVWWLGCSDDKAEEVLTNPRGAFSRRVRIPQQPSRTSAIEQQQAIDSDTESDFYDRDQLCATSIKSYNNSISLYGLQRSLHGGHVLSGMVQFVNTIISNVDIGTQYSTANCTGNRYSNEVYTLIETDGKKFLVQSEADAQMLSYITGYEEKCAWGNFVFFPNPDAKYMYIGGVDNNGNHYYFRVDLKRHDFLNGAYGYLGVLSDHYAVMTHDGIIGIQLSCEQTNRIPIYGKIYNSKLNNPFAFGAQSVVSFSGSEVIGMASATKALSQGQFGQFPMYAFTSDGIWALEVSASTGGYSAKQPVTRDVCINPLSITQGDNCIYFVSDRGLMLLLGSETACISDVLDDHFAQSLKDVLPGYGKFLGIAGMNEKSAAMPAFREFVKDAQIVYDYTNQRVIVFRPLADGEKENIAFAYSLLSKTWSTMPCSLTGKINSYPDALAVMNGKGIVNLSTITDGTEGTGMLITRPLALDAPEVHKTVDTIIQRGKFRKGCIKQALWGSRDLIHWHLVASSNSHILRHVHGTPFKWFRVGVIATLKDDETLTGCSINYTPKLTNKIR